MIENRIMMEQLKDYTLQANKDNIQLLQEYGSNFEKLDYSTSKSIEELKSKIESDMK